MMHILDQHMPWEKMIHLVENKVMRNQRNLSMMLGEEKRKLMLASFSKEILHYHYLFLNSFLFPQELVLVGLGKSTAVYIIFDRI